MGDEISSLCARRAPAPRSSSDNPKATLPHPRFCIGDTHSQVGAVIAASVDAFASHTKYNLSVLAGCGCRLPGLQNGCARVSWYKSKLVSTVGYACNGRCSPMWIAIGAGTSAYFPAARSAHEPANLWNTHMEAVAQSCWRVAGPLSPTHRSPNPFRRWLNLSLNMSPLRQ